MPTDYWRDVWHRALMAMPHKKRTYYYYGGGDVQPQEFIGFHNCKYGQQTALAKCLGYYSYCSVYNSFGCKPRSHKRQAALLKLAGPYGAILAKIKLRDPNTRLGKHRNRFKHVTVYRPSPPWNTTYLRWLQQEEIKTVVIDGHRYLRFGYHPATDGEVK